MDAKAEVIADLLKEYQAHKRIMEKLAVQLDALQPTWRTVFVTGSGGSGGGNAISIVRGSGGAGSALK